jgi:hypothetical protein
MHIHFKGEEVSTKKISLLDRIRGWFPQEPSIPRRNSSIHMPKMHKPLPQPLIGFIRFLVIYTAGISLFFAYSSLQIVLVITIVAFGIFWFASNRKHNISVSKKLSKCTVFMLAFIILFSGAQFFVFFTSGHPTTAVPQFSYSNIANISVTQYLQSVEQSQNFHLLQGIHFGTVTFERLELHAYSEGWLTWTFRSADTNSKITIGNVAGRPYSTNADNMVQSLFPQQALTTKDYTLQYTTETFRQIDKLGLGWFQNKALETYQNQPGTKLDVAASNIYIGFDDVGGYQGLTVVFQARGLDYDSSGAPVYPGLFEAEFKPDGTLLAYKNFSGEF